MRRVLILVVVAVVAIGIWWKREEAARTVVRLVPATAPYLSPGDDAKAAAAAPAAPRPQVPVVVATVQRKPLPVTIEAVGTVEPLASIQMKARIDSQIASINVQEGARVKEGDLLITLDNRALKAQLAQAEALVAKDKAQLSQVRRDLGRAEDLLAKRINSEVQRDTAATAVKVAEAQLAADEAMRSSLETSLSYTELRAPVSGRIGSIALKAGTTVKSGDAQAIMTVNQVDPIYVTFAVPQSLFGDLRRALAAAPVKVEARVAGGTALGVVTFVENKVDLATGTIMAKATMPNADERLWPGTFVSVRAVLGVEAEAVSVPSSAVLIGQQGAYVFVIKDDRRAEIVTVTVDRTIGGDSVIASGLSGGERVVVDGQLRLVNGAPVQVQQGKGSDGVAIGSDPPGQPQRRS
jgi:multidrug efflux system membrane fusion protein